MWAFARYALDMVSTLVAAVALASVSADDSGRSLTGEKVGDFLVNPGQADTKASGWQQVFGPSRLRCG